jgi:tetraacyldisaccharide 4'-kinase
MLSRLVSRLVRLHHDSAAGRPLSPGARALLALAAVVARLAAWVKRAAYRWRLLGRVRLPPLVVSVGNVTTGGSGKTPLAAWIVELLAREGARVVVLAQGYGRAGRGWAVWASRAGRVTSTAREAGDEAVLLARSLPGASVLAGKRRASTGRLAWALVRPDAIVLDDGFQYWRLARDLDVVALDLPLSAPRMRPFPVGVLREPLDRLSSADIVVLTGVECASEAALDEARALLARVAPGVPHVLASYRCRALRDPATGVEHAPDRVRGRRVVALAALARPERFFEQVSRLGAASVLRVHRPDHHRYRAGELAHLVRRALAWGADILVTTAKDEVNFPPGHRFGLEVLVLDIELVIRPSADLEAMVTRKLGARRTAAPPEAPPRRADAPGTHQPAHG